MNRDAVHSETLLRGALRGNALFSTISGVAFIVASKYISEVIGLDNSIFVLIVGVSLLGFAVGLLRNSLRELVNRTEARIAIGLDLAWVAGSGAIIATGILTTRGNWGVVIIADVVLFFAIAQYAGLRRLSRAET